MFPFNPVYSSRKSFALLGHRCRKMTECEELGGVEWEWQAADCAMGKARFGGAPSDATPRTVARPAASGASW